MAATVLVIDDDSTVRDSVVAYLDDCDYNMQSAGSAQEALDAIEVSVPDAVVCDLKMPGMHGIQLLEKLRENHPDLPVIVVSGAGVMDDVVHALRLGAADFLVKPILDLEVLVHSLRKALSHQSLQRENRAYREHLEATNRELKLGLDELRADQQAGRHAQLRMLPEPLSMGDVSCEHKLQPSLMLSGDFLDFMEVDDDRLAFYIADVSGHGASSAFVTVLLKNLTYRLKRNFQRGSSDDILKPDLVLARINSELLASELDKHLTMFYGVLTLSTGVLSYSVGGHFPMPVLISDGEAKFFEGRGMPVGLFKDAEYKSIDVELAGDFRLMMFSDGILEIIDEPSLNDKESKLLAMASEAEGKLDAFWSIAGVAAHDEVPDDIAVATVCRGVL
ncbi:MAG: SpoIIE family protein phosphatase [Thalassolituus sp.]|jgi:serine phosphatase RsbU (regulator of sigma subunit)|uniref:SpoIIE family protein phosphatase n=1 Tax=Thalassolituus sp. TaxID=2030822 RepID=UPI0027D766DE|nr:SpoIIE family protein phosphatase [Thalassolituus sp.]MDQ4424384.1 SpoIIE family protein phosphatase [Thalassolituus sp.]MDQ4427079.1 SpoIIE family protein phosphatase [Thalassolituus sp.]